MSEISKIDFPIQQISWKRSAITFIVAFIVCIFLVSLIEGAIEHFYQKREWSLELFKPDVGKLIAILFVAMIWTFFSIVENHNNLLKTQNNFINVIYPKITQDIGQMFFETGEKALKDTLIESMLSESLNTKPHKSFFHPYILKQLKELRSFDEELAPAIEVLANNRLISLQILVSNLKNDHAFHSGVEGIEQIDMSKAFVRTAANLILFYDPKTYSDLEKNWSESFKYFIKDTLSAKTSAKKIQYLVFNDSCGHDIHSDSKINAYKAKMESAGFKVLIVNKSSLSEVISNVNYGQRLEIYDNSAVVKIESKSDYSQSDKPKHDISLTLSTVRQDANLRTFLSALTEHSTPI